MAKVTTKEVEAQEMDTPPVAVGTETPVVPVRGGKSVSERHGKRTDRRTLVDATFILLPNLADKNTVSFLQEDGKTLTITRNSQRGIKLLRQFDAVKAKAKPMTVTVPAIKVKLRKGWIAGRWTPTDILEG